MSDDPEGGDGTDADAGTADGGHAASGTDDPAATERPGGVAGASLAIRGGLGFLTRFPVGTDARAWEAFRTTPWAFVAVGYVVGALAAFPLLLSWPAPTVALLYVVTVFAVTGINHLDGVADLGDAAVVHGDVERRHAVLKDSQLGVGGTVAVALVVAGLALAGLGLAGLPPWQAFAVAVAAEVGAKLGMAAMAALGRVAFDGLGAQLTRVATRGSLFPALLLALPAAFLGLPEATAALALVAGVGTALATLWWATRRLGGVSGDVFGAANELARVAALHAGVVAWTLS